MRNTPLPTIDRKTRQKKISKATKYLNNTVDYFDVTDIYRTLHSTTVEYLFSQVHMVYSPRRIACLATKQVSINLTGFK